MKNIRNLLIVSLVMVSCGDTSDIEIVKGPPGEKGETGTQGEQGDVGPQGEAGTQGEQGEQGEAGADAVLKVIDPCGDNPGQPDEILLVLANGDILAYFETGGDRFLSILQCNTRYVTTDPQRCFFSLDSECEYSE